MIRLLLAALLAAAGLVVLTPGASFACSCAVSSEVQQRAWADTVFTGRLARIEPSPVGPDGVIGSTDPTTYRFTVEEVVKGEAPLTVEIRSARYGASCGLERMKPGSMYVVYATEARDELWSGLCSGTHRVPTVEAPPTPVAGLWAAIAAFLGLGTGA